MKTTAALLAALLLAACGTDRVSGGNGTSTDNVVTARKLSVDSLSANLPDGDDRAYPLLVRIDSNTLDFASAHSDGRDLRVTDDSGALPFQLREWDNQSRNASLWVRLPKLERGAGRSVTLRVNRDSGTSRSSRTATWNGVSDSVKMRVASVLLSDFESNGLLVETPCRCNAWYTSRSAQASLVPSRSGIDSAGKGRPGKAFHLSYFGAPTEWALLGTRLGDGLIHPSYRFAGLDSITLWVRGNGVVRIALEDGRDLSTLSKAWATVVPDPNVWKPVTITPSEFDSPNPYNKGWDAVKNRINTFTIFGQEGSDIWVDDIRLHGISPAEIP